MTGAADFDDGLLNQPKSRPPRGEASPAGWSFRCIRLRTKAGDRNPRCIDQLRASSWPVPRVISRVVNTPFPGASSRALAPPRGAGFRAALLDPEFGSVCSTFLSPKATSPRCDLLPGCLASGQLAHAIPAGSSQESEVSSIGRHVTATLRRLRAVRARPHHAAAYRSSTAARRVRPQQLLRRSVAR